MGSVLNHIGPGIVRSLARETATGAGEFEQIFVLDSDAIVVSLFVESVVGTLTVTMQTLDGESNWAEIITFPTISSPTANLLLRKSTLALGRLKLVVTYTDACSYVVTGKGITTADTTVSIAGATNASATQKTISNVAVPVISTSLDDRKAMILRNYSETHSLFIGFTMAEANATTGFPLEPKESIPVDLEAGVAVWGIAPTGDVDVRIMQAGG